MGYSPFDSYDYEAPDYESLSRAYPMLESLVVDNYYGRPNGDRVKAVDMLFYDLFGVRDAGKILATHRRSERDDAMKANLIRACGGRKLTDMVLRPRMYEDEPTNFEMLSVLVKAYCDISRGAVKESKRDDIIRFYKKTIEKLRFENGIEIRSIDMIDNPLKMMKKYLQKSDDGYGYGNYGIGDYSYGYDRNYRPFDYNYGNSRDYDYSGDVVSSIFDCLDDDERRQPKRSRRPKGKGKSPARRRDDDREDDDDGYSDDDREPSYVRDLLDAINQLNQNIANQNNDSYDDSFCEREHQVHFMPDYPLPSQTPPPQPAPQPQVVQAPPATEVNPEIKKMFATLTNSINTLAKRQDAVSQEVGTLTERYNEVADFLNNSYDELEEEESPGNSPGNVDTPSDLGRTTGGVNSKTATIT